MDKFMEFSLLRGWRELDEDPMPWEDGVDIERHLKSHGYYPFGDRLGEDGAGWSAVMYGVNHSSRIQPKYPYVVDIGNSSESRFVFCVDFLSGVEIMCRYASLVTTDLISGVVNDLESRLEVERKETRALTEKRWREQQEARQLLASRPKSIS